jgi:cardiolipin synthase
MHQGQFTVLLLASVYLIAFAHCIRVLTNERTTPGAAIAWILFLLILPVIAIPLYWLVGDFRLSGYVKRHRERTQELAHESPALHHEYPENSPASLETCYPIVESGDELFKTSEKVFSQLGPIYQAYPGSAELLVDGKTTFKAIFEKIAGAQAYILVQYYIVRHDRLGLELKRLLIAKAKEGIPVYFLYDDMGSFWLSTKYINDLKKHGIKIAQFLEVASFKRFFQMNFRNHRKIVVVDGLYAFTGGLNVGEEYIAPKSKKTRRYWRDTHLLVTGLPVQQVEEVFLEDWHFATDQAVILPEKKPDITPQSATGERFYPIRVVPTGPADDLLVSMIFLQTLIWGAQERLWIASPYFVPDQSLLRALQIAILRGVDVRVMIPSVGDNRLVQWATLSFGDQVRKMGGKVLLYQAGFMHQKVILVDRSTVALGTMNLDNRAIYLNFETMILIHDEAMADKVEKMLENDFLSCHYLGIEPRPFIRKLVGMRGNATKILSPLL